MNLTIAEALALLNALKGSPVLANVRVNFSPANDGSIGVVRFDSEAILEACDGDGILLSWGTGKMRIAFERASFRCPNPEETALVGLEIILDEGVKCVICPAR